MREVTRMLQAIESGDPKAAGELLPLVCNELRLLAAQQLAPVSREDITEAILGQATNYFRNLPFENLTPKEEYNRSLAYENLGNLNLNLGRWNMDAAEPYYRQALALRRKALATDPNNFEWQRGMAQLYIEFSEVFTQRSENEEYLRYGVAPV